MDPQRLMQLAIDAAQDGIEKGQSPFGCAIAIGERILACRHNSVWMTTDATAHAEINAIRQANLEYGSIFLPEATVASTCEPCPMCMAALHWTRVGNVYYGATIADAADVGFNELHLPAASLLEKGGSDIHLNPNCLRDECLALFADWITRNPQTY